jgi:hypothetical protein
LSRAISARESQATNNDGLRYFELIRKLEFRGDPRPECAVDASARLELTGTQKITPPLLAGLSLRSKIGRLLESGVDLERDGAEREAEIEAGRGEGRERGRVFNAR